MKKTLFAIMLVITSNNCFSQATIEEIKEDYQKNPQRAIDNYLNKASITMRVQIQSIYYSKSINPIWNNLVCIKCIGNAGYSYDQKLNSDESIEVQDVSYSDAIKLNSHDSIVVKGILSGRGEKLNSPQWDGKYILLKKSKIVAVINSDEDFKKVVIAKYSCRGCTTGIKQFQEYSIENTLNGLRAKKNYINKPLIVNVVIKKFIQNIHEKHIPCGVVYDGQFKHYIELYGFIAKDNNKINIGQEIKVKGNLGESPPSMYYGGEYETITLNNCSLISINTKPEKHCMCDSSVSKNEVVMVNCPCVLKQEKCTCYTNIQDGSVCYGDKHFVRNGFLYDIDSIKKNNNSDTIEILYLTYKYTNKTSKDIFYLPITAKIAKGNESIELQNNKVFFYTGHTANESIYCDEDYINPKSLVKDFTAPF